MRANNFPLVRHIFLPVQCSILLVRYFFRDTCYFFFFARYLFFLTRDSFRSIAHIFLSTAYIFRVPFYFFFAAGDTFLWATCIFREPRSSILLADEAQPPPQCARVITVRCRRSGSL